MAYPSLYPKVICAKFLVPVKKGIFFLPEGKPDNDLMWPFIEVKNYGCGFFNLKFDRITEMLF